MRYDRAISAASRYPRTTGASVDIGAVQFDTIFVSDFDFIF